MISLIKPTGIYSSIDVMTSRCQELIDSVGWGEKNQIGLTKRPSDHDNWFEAAGTLYDRQKKIYLGHEHEFTEFNSISTELITEISKVLVQENCKFGRIRLLRLLPKTGLTVHRDLETRYHYVLSTNQRSYMCFNNIDNTDPDCKAQCYHIPLDGQWYLCDTTATHWVYNGGDTDRIHLVINRLS